MPGSARPSRATDTSRTNSPPGKSSTSWSKDTAVGPSAPTPPSGSTTGRWPSTSSCCTSANAWACRTTTSQAARPGRAALYRARPGRNVSASHPYANVEDRSPRRPTSKPIEQATTRSVTIPHIRPHRRSDRPDRNVAGLDMQEPRLGRPGRRLQIGLQPIPVGPHGHPVDPSGGLLFQYPHHRGMRLLDLHPAEGPPGQGCLRFGL